MYTHTHCEYTSIRAYARETQQQLNAVVEKTKNKEKRNEEEKKKEKKPTIKKMRKLKTTYFLLTRFFLQKQCDSHEL